MKHESSKATLTEDLQKESPHVLSPTHSHSTRGRTSRKQDNDSEPIETLFIPEDLSRYAEILGQVRRLLVRGEGSTDDFDHEVSDSVDPVAKLAHPRGTSPEEFKDKDTKASGETQDNTAKNKSQEELGAKTSNSGEDKFLKSRETPEVERNSKLPENGEKYSARNPDAVSVWTAMGHDGDAETVLVESDGENLDEKTEPDEEDLVEAANFGLEAMKNLYLVKEPTLYSMGEFWYRVY